jgi:hypothetical protein
MSDLQVRDIGAWRRWTLRPGHCPPWILTIKESLPAAYPWLPPAQVVYLMQVNWWTFSSSSVALASYLDQRNSDMSRYLKKVAIAKWGVTVSLQVSYGADQNNSSRLINLVCTDQHDSIVPLVRGQLSGFIVLLVASARSLERYDFPAGEWLVYLSPWNYQVVHACILPGLLELELIGSRFWRLQAATLVVTRHSACMQKSDLISLLG